MVVTPQAGGDQGLHHDHVVGRVADLRLVALVGAERKQVAAAPVAAGDPGGVAKRGQSGSAVWGQQVDRVVEQVVQVDAVGLGLGLVIAEDDRDVDLAGAQQLERSWGMCRSG
jgi:hypothetical protein